LTVFKGVVRLPHRASKQRGMEMNIYNFEIKEGGWSIEIISTSYSKAFAKAKKAAPKTNGVKSGLKLVSKSEYTQPTMPVQVV